MAQNVALRCAGDTESSHKFACLFPAEGMGEPQNPDTVDVYSC